MTLNQLQYFYQAAKTQHFTHAAENLSISQPSLSRAISSLENELGVMLFERVGRNVTLTKAGQIFLEQTEKILDDIAVAERKMEQMACSGGEISVAYVSPLSTRFIPQTVRSFSRIEENRDVIFGTRDISEMSVRFIPLMRQEMVVILPEGHELCARDRIEASCFEQYPVLTYDHISGLGRHTENFYRRHNLRPSVICESPDENGIASLVEEGFGIALVADVDYIHRPGICIRHLAEGQEFYHTVYMGYLAGKYQIPAVSSFIKFVRDACAQEDSATKHEL